MCAELAAGSSEHGMEEPHSSGADDVLRAGGWSQAIIACPHSNCMRRNLRVQERSDRMHSQASWAMAVVAREHGWSMGGTPWHVLLLRQWQLRLYA